MSCFDTYPVLEPLANWVHFAYMVHCRALKIDDTWKYTREDRWWCEILTCISGCSIMSRCDVSLIMTVLRWHRWRIVQDSWRWWNCWHATKLRWLVIWLWCCLNSYWCNKIKIRISFILESLMRECDSNLPCCIGGGDSPMLDWCIGGWFGFTLHTLPLADNGSLCFKPAFGWELLLPPTMCCGLGL